MKKIKFKRKITLEQINYYIMIYIVASCIFPPMKLIPKSNLLISIASFIWFGFSFINKKKYTIKLKFYNIAVLFFVFYTFIVAYISQNYVIGNRYLNFSQCFFFYLMYCFYKTNKKIILKKILKISAIMISLTSIRTFIALIYNPYISRSIKSSGEYSEELWKQGIGGYELIYMLPFISVILFFFGFITKNKCKYNLFLKIAFLFTIILIVISNYFTALLISLSGILGLLLLEILKRKNYFLILGLSFLSINFFLLKKQIIRLILDNMIYYVPNGRTKDRLIQFELEFSKGRKSELLDERIMVNRESIESFKNNKFFGIIVEKIKTKDGYLTGFGQHSQLLDTFALYGFFIGVLQIYLLVYPFIKIQKKSITYRTISFIICIQMLVLFYNNIATPSIGYILFFIFPAICDYNDGPQKLKE